MPGFVRMQIKIIMCIIGTGTNRSSGASPAPTQHAVLSKSDPTHALTVVDPGFG